MALRLNKAVVAWSLYDWANSAFTTLVVTFVYATYFTQAIAPDEVTGTAQWSRGVALSAILIALLSPVLGAAADRSNRHRFYLGIATVLCIVSTAALTFVAPGTQYAMVLAIALFVVANVAFEIGGVFYNAFLPAVAGPGRIGRVSGFGWGLGYVGGLLCLALSLAVLVREDPLFGISTADGFNYRATNLLVAAWFAIFCLPMFLFVPAHPATGAPGPGNGVGGAFRELARTLGNLRQFRDAALFLLARLVYNDGLVTIFAFGGIYAAGTFGMSLAEVIRFGIVINVAAGLGAWAFGFVDDRFGGRSTVLISLVALCGFTMLAAAAPSEAWLWVAAVGIGAFVGPNQSASRSLMGRFVPTERHAEFFGFFAFSGKITSFFGPLLLGLVTQWTGSQRWGVATVVLFLAAGAVLLLAVDERRGVAAGQAAS